MTRSLATYGQAFWSGYSVVASEDTEVLTVPKKKWNQTTNTADKGASLDVTEFLFAHPLFAGCTKNEMAQVLTGVKVMSLDQMTLLFRAGDSVADVYLVRFGEIELRTELEIERGTLSAGGKHRIPSAVVASMGRNAVANDVPNEEDIVKNNMQLPEILLTWMTHPEHHSAVVVSKATVIAIAKSQVRFRRALRSNFPPLLHWVHSAHRACDAVLQRSTASPPAAASAALT